MLSLISLFLVYVSFLTNKMMVITLLLIWHLHCRQTISVRFSVRQINVKVKDRVVKLSVCSVLPLFTSICHHPITLCQSVISGAAFLVSPIDLDNNNSVVFYRSHLWKPVSMKQTKHSRKSEAQNLCSLFTRTHAFQTTTPLRNRCRDDSVHGPAAFTPSADVLQLSTFFELTSWIHERQTLS